MSEARYVRWKQINNVIFHGKMAMQQVHENCCSHISEIRANKEFRREWAERCISGKVIARYMVDCLSGEKVNEPWLRKL